MGNEPSGTSISSLLKKLDFGDDVVNLAKKIDRYFIPIRYMVAWSEGLPGDYYTIEDAEEAISYSKLIMKSVEEKWKSLKRE